MQKLLFVIDMQNDFIDGALGTPEAQAIVENVKEKIIEFDGSVYFTRDTHFDNYLETQEGRNLPVPHCIKDTEGWQIRKELQKFITTQIIDKVTFGSAVMSIVLMQLQQKEPIESITFVGLCTDICVISNALIAKAYVPEAEIIVDASCCAGVTPESHKTALEAMKACQITIINE